MNIGRTGVAGLLVVCALFACGCLSSPPKGQGEGVILAEAVPIGLDVTVEGTAPNRLLKICPKFLVDTKTDSVYRFEYDVRYAAATTNDVHADPEQHLTISEDARVRLIAYDGEKLETLVPIIEKAAGSASMKVYVSIALWKTGEKPGATGAATITFP